MGKIQMQKRFFCLPVGLLAVFWAACGQPAKKAAVYPATGQSEEDEAQDITTYREFMERRGWLSLTATIGYPKGDSQAAYAFGDCTGDGVPELHIDGGFVGSLKYETGRIWSTPPEIYRRREIYSGRWGRLWAARIIAFCPVI